MKRSKVIQVVHYGMVYPVGALTCHLHLQLMWFVIHCVGILVFHSDFAMNNSVTVTRSVTVMSSLTKMNSAAVTCSVTVSLPMTEIDFVR